MSKKLICLTAVGLMLAIAGSAGAQVGKGSVLIEEWFTASSGNTITDQVSTLHAYINAGKVPNKAYWAKKLDRPDAGEDYWGARMRGYLYPPETGDYTFWTASDDQSEVWLSTDENPANVKMICNVSGWMNYQDWTYTSGAPGTTYKSAPIKLEAGKRYYVDVFFSDGTGGGFDTVAWGGPGIGAGPVVVDGKYLAAFLRDPEPLFKASNPDPSNGKTEVTNPLFTWTAGATAVMHEVYCGTNPTPGPAEFMGPWPTNMYFHVFGLTPGATYYWRVDEVDATGTKYVGDVWSFTAQPLEAHFPSPVDGALWRSTNTTVSWTAGQGAVKHKVYGGEDKAAVAAGAAGALLATVTEAKLDASALLQPGKTYYWRVDEVDSTGKEAAGPVWTFSTVDPAGGAIAEYYTNNSLTGMPAVVTTVPNVNFSWPSGSVKGTNSPDAAIPVDNFSARFTAQLNVPVSGKYKLYDASDDGARLFLNGAQITNGWVNRGETEDASAELDLVAGQSYVLVMEYYEATGGAAARLRWSGPGIAKEIIPQGALQLPQCAISPNPGNNAVEVGDWVTPSFTPGPKAVVHTMYFGTDKAKVTAGDPSVAMAPTQDTKYVPAKLLTWNTTYYWKVDEMAADGTTVPGQVWSFTTANWIPVNAGQVTLNFNNKQAPYMSQLAFDVPADLTAGGVTDLALRFQGSAGPRGGVVYNDANATYKVTGAGTDIWNNGDQFQYAYKTLSGDATMVARVTNIGPGANTWAKGGVMIRQSLDAGSMHAYMPMTANSDGSAGNGASFQRRLATAGGSSNSDSGTKVAPPYWVKIERKGTSFAGYISPDGQTWTQLGATVTIPMVDPVYIGLAVTSHVDTNTSRTITFDNVQICTTTGSVAPAGPFLATDDIGQTSTDPAPLYVAIEDKAGKMATVAGTNPAATNVTVADLWRIPMSAFTGVDLKNAAKLYVGVGDGKAGGSGTVNFADIRIIKPVVLPDPTAVDITAKGDSLKGYPDYSGAWPAAEYPALAIDDSITTKYLNFGGKTQPPCGFCVTPTVGATVVTGLTFTTANDSAERDPVAWELWGSNKSIDGPWEFIAKGAVDDFARPLDWPRRWKTVTPIGFANAAAYASYKVQFTGLKRFSAANSMQIAEVEILGVPAPTASLAMVNFQSNSQGDKVVPDGYLPDYGLPFADQGNGFSYGWSRNISADARDRNSKNSPDQRYDTFLHLQKGDPAVWEIAIPNGNYQVFIVGGDPDNTDQMNSFDVEGVIVPDADGQGDRWDAYVVNVTVADGRLTIKPALGATPAASNSKISFVVINAK